MNDRQVNDCGLPNHPTEILVPFVYKVHWKLPCMWITIICCKMRNKPSGRKYPCRTFQL